MKRGPTTLAALLLALAACGDEDKTQTDSTPSNDRASTSVDDTAVSPAPAVAVRDTALKKSPPQDTFAIILAPLGRSTVRGSGQVGAAGKASSVSVTLTGGAPGATYEGAIRQGTCAGAGASIAPLFPVSADSLGNGRAASDVPVPIDSLTKKPHVVVYGPGGRPVTCAPIPGSPAPPPPTRPAAPDTTAADTVRV
jgi:hypothetical protein